MLKFAADLSDDFEYAIVWGGQSNSRPWGSKQEGFQEAPELELESAGIDLTTVVLTSTNNSGTGARIAITPAIKPNSWQGAELRLFSTASNGKHYTAPQGGYAIVRANPVTNPLTGLCTELIVDWVSPAVGPTGTALTGTVAGYLVRPDGKWQSYPNIRVLTPYQPEAGMLEVDRTVIDYPATTTKKLGAAGYVLPAGVTSFEDLGLFLPFTFLEGIDSYGISSEADSANGTNGARTILAASSTGLAISSANNIDTPVNALSGGFVMVEWLEDVGGANTPRRSWARLLGNSLTSDAGENFLRVDSAGWQGDGIPQFFSGALAPVAGCTIAAGAPQVTAPSGTPFSTLTAGDLVICNGSIGIVASIGGGGANITLTAAGWYGGTPTTPSSVTCYATPGYGVSTSFQAWIPHYNNNPHSYLPGQGFAYPNNDLQPHTYSKDLNNQIVAGNATSTGAGPTIMTDSSATWEPNIFVGYKVTIGSSFAIVTGNTGTTLQGAWIGGTPSPGAYTLQNTVGTGARIHNRPRGVTPFAYGNKFGALISYASQLSASLGKRINIIALGVNSSPIYQQKESNYFGFPGKIGWWDYHEHLTWAPSKANGSAARLKKLITQIAPNALLAESNAKPLRIMGIVWIQGEGDSGTEHQRTNYSRTLKAFVSWLRDLIEDAGLSPYEEGAKIPFVQPRITRIPYMLAGRFDYYNALTGFTITFNLTGDDKGYINSAIIENAMTDGFAATVDNDDLTKVGDTSLANSIDPLHYDGVGEAKHGRRLAQLSGELIDYALSFGSPCLQHSIKGALDICNAALAQIGETGLLTSLADGSVAANLCRMFYPKARRTLLQARRWGFALRRIKLLEVKAPPPEYMNAGTLYAHWAYCYAVPAEALCAFAVLPDDPNSDYTQLVRDEGGLAYPQLLAGGPAPMPFAIEMSPTGGRLIFTNQAEATLRYTADVTDTDRFDHHFKQALIYLLAGMLAPPIVKGAPGQALSQQLMRMAAGYAMTAAGSDATQRSIKLEYVPDHIAFR